MAAEIPVPRTYAPIDLDNICQNWRDDASGTARACGNRFSAIRACANALNHLLAYGASRVLFSALARWTEEGYTEAAVDQDPFVQWRFDENNPNGRDWRYRFIGFPVDAETSYIQRNGSSGDEAKSNLAPDDGIATQPDDFYEETIEYSRGTTADAETTEGIDRENSFQVHAICMQEVPPRSLDTSVHTYVDVKGGPGDDIVANHLQALCTKFHTVRAVQLPVLSWWVAEPDRSTGTYLINTSATAGNINGDRFGISVQTTTLTNVIDKASTSRTAVTPGLMCPVQYCGRGTTAKTAGKKVKVQCRALVETSGVTGTIRFEGPSTFASNTTDITFTNTTAAWVGSSSNYILLDASALDTATDTTRNKIDVYAKMATSGELYECRIFGWCLWMEYI